ncbi:MAG: M1 family aminopeptidase [Planctomycetaceae bacterium]
MTSTLRSLCFLVLLPIVVLGQADDGRFTLQDYLRGSVTPERAWWDVLHYRLSLEVFPEEKRISGSNEVTFKVLRPARRMQIDLQTPLEITRVTRGDEELKFEREGNVYWITLAKLPQRGSEHRILIEYSGVPTESKRPPWSGGLTWTKDDNGKHFIATTCQGIGASIWWPNKDHCYDEPDRGMDIVVTVPDDLSAVSNGRLVKTEDKPESRKTFHWRVTNPINNYAVNLNVGDYIHLSDKYEGEKGPLDVEYWVLRGQRELAEKHFREAPRTLEAFEYWFGPYPFYEDSYKLVVVPYLGMEHQSSVTYGNGFQNGYRGRDLSKTGVGLKFDFIIVHESGHEWFGNNITAKDIADMWVHEGFTNYSENLFVNYHFTKKEAEDYVIGCRDLVSNKTPIIGVYNVNKSGSGDMYYKGGNMLHTIRNVIDDDDKWRRILRGLNSQFRHQTVTTQQIEDYVSQEAGIDLSSVFDQYLRTTMIPTLKYGIEGSSVRFHFENVVENFRVRVRVSIDGNTRWITPTTKPVTIKLATPPKQIELDRNFYMNLDEAA